MQEKQTHNNKHMRREEDFVVQQEFKLARENQTIINFTWLLEHK